MNEKPTYGILESWNNHRDHGKMGEIYVSQVPKYRVDVEKALNEYICETTGGEVNYSADRNRMLQEGKIQKYE